jgi:hypothetical protein
VGGEEVPIQGSRRIRKWEVRVGVGKLRTEGPPRIRKWEERDENLQIEGPRRIRKWEERGENLQIEGPRRITKAARDPMHLKLAVTMDMEMNLMLPSLAYDWQFQNLSGTT